MQGFTGIKFQAFSGPCIKSSAWRFRREGPERAGNASFRHEGTHPDTHLTSSSNLQKKIS